MVYAFIRSLIGSFGRALIDFYIQNSLWINTIILIYALLVVFAHRNYFVVLQQIFMQIRSSNEKYLKEGIVRVSPSDYGKIDWDEIRRSMKFPLVSKPKSWGIKWLNRTFLEREFDINKLNEFLTAARKQKD